MSEQFKRRTSILDKFPIMEGSLLIGVPALVLTLNHIAEGGEKALNKVQAHCTEKVEAIIGSKPHNACLETFGPEAKAQCQQIAEETKEAALSKCITETTKTTGNHLKWCIK